MDASKLPLCPHPNENLTKISTEKAKDIWLGADHFSAHYRTKLYLASSDLIC
jgi:hypothetical protein